MNERGVIPLAVALIIAGAVLISGFMIVYKPEIHCSVGDNKPVQQQPNAIGGSGIIIKDGDRSILQMKAYKDDEQQAQDMAFLAAMMGGN